MPCAGPGSTQRDIWRGSPRSASPHARISGGISRSARCLPFGTHRRRDATVGTRILTVEDDERIRTAVKLALEDEGWQVTEASSGEDALGTFTREPADVVLIDIMLPGIDGFEVCRSIRRISDVPIIMVTARADTHDVVAGLEAGADDYLTKPFAPKELSARIRALLRRVRTSDPGMSRLVFGDLEIVPDEGVVRRAGEELHLTKTEFRLLVELGTNPGRVLSREVLLERVWGYGYFGDGRLVDVHVRRLRTKVERDPANPRHVVTVRGLGYKLQS
ncbi:MAG: response regulator [Actinobacteria bacterium]|nr:response regulator [Actinomycetota bacterium]